MTKLRNSPTPQILIPGSKKQPPILSAPKIQNNPVNSSSSLDPVATKCNRASARTFVSLLRSPAQSEIGPRRKRRTYAPRPSPPVIAGIPRSTVPRPNRTKRISGQRCIQGEYLVTEKSKPQQRPLESRNMWLPKRKHAATPATPRGAP